MKRHAKVPKCSSHKAAYPTQGAALNALRHIAIEQAQSAAPTVNPPTAAYHCVECGAWHLTRSVGGSNVAMVL